MTPTSHEHAGAPSAAPVVHLRDAAFGYGGRSVISGITLTVSKGEVIALVGPNGSGKSTLTQGLLGLSELLGGTAQLFGHRLEDKALRHRVGYVPQQHTISTSIHATVSEVVGTGLLSSRRWWQPQGSAGRAAVRTALESVGLADRAKVDIATLSGGQQRRALIARALVSGPELIIMDEPTAGVDRASQASLARVIHDLAESGKTLLVVTHELAPLRDVTDRIVHVEGGTVHLHDDLEPHHAGTGEWAE